MANTMAAPVTNNIVLAEKFLPLIDEVYRRESLTAFLDSSNAEWVGVDTVKLMNLQTVGMGNYDRNAGYVPGDVNASWETFKVGVDRGRALNVDYLDNDETLGVIAGQLLGEEERVHVIPEIDAYRFAKWAGTPGIAGTTGTLTKGTTLDAISDAEADMDDNEVPYMGRILFVNPTVYKYLKGEIERRIINSENNVNMNVEYFDDMRVIRVPSSRFNTQITLNAASASSDQGGYTATGNAINFMILHPTAVLQVMRHYRLLMFAPEQNIEADGFRFNFRYSHDTFIKANKKKGIYLHATA